MKLYIDGELQNEDKYDEDKNLREFLEEIRKQYLQADVDRVMRVRVDGKVVNDDLLEDNPSIGEFEEIVLEYSTIEDISYEMIEKLTEHYSKTLSKLESAEADFKLGTGSKGYDILLEVSEDMYNLYDLLLSLRDWDDDNENKKIIEDNMRQLAKMPEVMEDTKDAIDNKGMLEFISDELRPMMEELENEVEYWEEFQSAVIRANEADELELNK